MEWNVAGNVSSGTVKKDDLCSRYDVSFISDFLRMLCRYTMSRVMFTTGAKFVGWAECMDTCPKYNRARAPSIPSRAALQELVSWTHSTIRDPDTMELYPGVGRFQGLWLPYR